jgi:hypothetical protein
MPGLALLLCLTGCTAPSNGNTHYIDQVKGFRPERNGLTVETLLDLQTYPGIETATVTDRVWEAEPDGANWSVSFIAKSSGGDKIWKWEVDAGGQVSPTNEMATQLAAYDTTMQGRLGAAVSPSASPSETPSPVAVVTETPAVPPPTATVTVTVSPTAAPLPVATSAPAATPVPKPVAVAPPKPPSVVEYKGLLQEDDRMVATLVIDGEYYQASPGETVVGYRVLRITPSEVDMRYQGQDVRAVMVPHAGGVQFTPAAPDGPTGRAQGGVAVPGETPIELQPR